MAVSTLSVLADMQTAEQVFELGNNVLKDFDLFESISETTSSSVEIPIHCDLAYSIGALTSESFKQMDEHLKIMIGATLKTLENLEDKSWGSLVSIFTQNPFMERVVETDVFRTPIYTNCRGKEVFKVDGSPKKEIVNEVKSWYQDDLIKDEDVYRSSKIDIDELARIVASSGARISNFKALFAKKTNHDKSVLDIGVIRFPDTTNPFVKLYRIQVKAWANCTRILMVEENKNGISGEFNSVKFKPRKEVLDELKLETVKSAIEEAESMFD